MHTWEIIAVAACILGATHANKEVTVFMNKVWPALNPVETYRYYDFPFCAPPVIEEASMSFGQILRGDRLVSSLYKLTVGEQLNKKSVCSKQLSPADVASFVEAIKEKYLYEIVIAGLPVSVAVGSYSPQTRQYSLCTHLKFVIGHFGDEVVSGTVDCLEHYILPNDPKTDQVVEFFYTVDWLARTDIDPKLRIAAQQSQLNGVLSLMGVMGSSVGASNGKISSTAVHWISIFNSLILSLMICSLVVVILVRIVRSDLSKYLPVDSELIELGNKSSALPDSAVGGESSDEEGINSSNPYANSGMWKLLHGDVFRPPIHRMWLCAAIGSGTQLLFVLSTVAIVGSVIGGYVNRGTLISVMVVLYMVSSLISGYVSARLYQRIGGVKWRWSILVTALFFTGPAFLVWSILNTIAIIYNSTAAFPFLTILQLFAMWALVTLPLTVIGSVVGRQVGAKISREVPFPVKTNRLAREIPPKSSSFGSVKFQLLVVGFLSFWSIYLELKFVFQSLWVNSQLYSLYGILLIAVALLFLLSTVLTVLFAYFHLNAENYKWWWRSFLSGGSVAGYFMCYCVYFYVNSQMYGVVQTSFFFLYSALIALAIALATGAASFAVTYRFVWFIYSHVKSD